METNDFELNSDINKEANRLNESQQPFQAFYELVKRQVDAKENMTNVPGASVFDAAVEVDDEIVTTD